MSDKESKNQFELFKIKLNAIKAEKQTKIEHTNSMNRDLSDLEMESEEKKKLTNVNLRKNFNKHRVIFIKQQASELISNLSFKPKDDQTYTYPDITILLAFNQFNSLFEVELINHWNVNIMALTCFFHACKHTLNDRPQIRQFKEKFKSLFDWMKLNKINRDAEYDKELIESQFDDLDNRIRSYESILLEHFHSFDLDFYPRFQVKQLYDQISILPIEQHISFDHMRDSNQHLVPMETFLTLVAHQCDDMQVQGLPIIQTPWDVAMAAFISVQCQYAQTQLNQKEFINEVVSKIGSITNFAIGDMNTHVNFDKANVTSAIDEYVYCQNVINEQNCGNLKQN